MTIEENFKNYVLKNYEVVNSKYKKQGKSIYPTVNDIIRTYNELMEKLGAEEISSELASKLIEEALPIKAKAKPVKEVIPEIGEVGSFLLDILTREESAVKVNNRGDMISFVSGGTRVQATEKTVLAYANVKVNEMGLDGIYRRELLKDGWELLSKHFVAACTKKLQYTIKYDESVDKSVLNNFIKYIYDYLIIKEDYDIFEMLFKHWMWSLKRRIFGKKVVWHIWPNFQGAQGIGKSELITRMLSFMEDFVTDADLGTIQDIDREIKKFTDYFVIFFDELKQGDNKDNNDLQLSDAAIDMIKGIMTQEKFNVRIMGGQTQNRFINTVVPISCANKHLYDIIYDGEAMRRWFEFTCQRDKIPESYDELNSVLATFKNALQCIDENNDKGYWIKGSDTDKKIVEIQKHYIPTATSTNTWIDYCHVTPDYNRSATTSFMAPAYKQYCTYCRSVGKHAAGMQRVTMILGRLWPECIDDKGFAHIFIEHKVDDITGNLVKNDILASDNDKLSFLKQNKIDDTSILWEEHYEMPTLEQITEGRTSDSEDDDFFTQLDKTR